MSFVRHHAGSLYFEMSLKRITFSVCNNNKKDNKKDNTKDNNGNNR